MKFYLFSTDGWATQEYTKRTGDLPDNAHALPAGTQINLAFWNGSEVVEKTQPERDVYDAEQIATAKLAQTTFAQLDIREAFKALGEKPESGVNEQTLDSLLDGSSELKKYWLEARSGIDLNHPVTQSALIALSPDEAQRTALINALKMEM